MKRKALLVVPLVLVLLLAACNGDDEENGQTPQNGDTNGITNGTDGDQTPEAGDETPEPGDTTPAPGTPSPTPGAGTPSPTPDAMTPTPEAGAAATPEPGTPTPEAGIETTPEPGVVPDVDGTPTPTPDGTPAPGEAAANAVAITMNAQNESGQDGAALLVPRNGQTLVLVALQPGDVQSEPIHIHTGTCEDLGDVEYPLTNLEDSVVSATMVDVSMSELMEGEFAINSHSQEDTSIFTSCGDIEMGQEPEAAGADTTALSVMMDAQNESGQNGGAILVTADQQTMVLVGLQPGEVESEPIHIHTGTCEDLGDVEYPLENLEEGASVSTVEVALSELIEGDFAINAHQQDDPSIFTSCGNIEGDGGGAN